MSTRKTAFIHTMILLIISLGIIFLAFASLPAWANDSSIDAVGGAVRLMEDGYSPVAMRSAHITINLATQSVECEYVFENTGEATDVQIGFPESGFGDVSIPEGNETHFREFRSWVDGEEVRVTPMPAEESDGYSRFWVKTVHFSAGQTREVRNTYFGITGGNVMGLSIFDYQVSPAASWKGRVGIIDVEVDMSGMGTFSLQSITPEGYDLTADSISWQWTDIEPDTDMDISISYFEGYDDIWIDGGKYDINVPSLENAVIGSFNPYPRVNSDGTLMVSCRDIADGLGLDYSFNEDDYSVTLEDRNTTLVITSGEDVAELNGRRYQLGTFPYYIETTMQVPFRLVVEAFGGKVQFDPLTNRTYVSTAENIAAMPEPEWLNRRLTEAELDRKTSEQLRLMRNTIYARYGREFQDREFRHYFYCQPWYQPNPHYTDALLTELDLANIDLIVAAEGSE
ncbi:MAG: YARHG domain-containing protein [bacterium]|nr:YARHG domain-containing protein [bacterium]